MGHLFDKLAKDAAADLPRRQVFRLIGGSLIGVVLAAVGLSADKENCGRLCAICCDNNFSPPRGKEHNQCLQDCRDGIGTCGTTGAIACLQD